MNWQVVKDLVAYGRAGKEVQASISDFTITIMVFC